MLTIIGYLIILLAALLGSQDIPAQNFLLNTGLLVLTAYVCGKLAHSLRIPTVIGYIVAGVIVGTDGVELVSAGFAIRLRFIEEILFMVLIAHAARSIFKPRLPQHAARIFSAGALTSVLAFLITLGLVASLTVSFEMKIIISLFASSLSPVIIFRFTADDSAAKHLLLMSFGGFVTATILWGVITPFMDPSVTAKVRLASMPVFIAVVSTVMGIVWGFAAEKLLLGTRTKAHSVYPLAVMFLMYPLVNELGLDSIFLAIGVGVFNGLLSERTPTFIEESEFPALMVFSYFGMQISLQNMVLLPDTSWSLIAILVAVLAFTRVVGAKVAMNVIPRTSRKVPSALLLSLSGPLTVIQLRRFLPGYQSSLPTEMSIFHVLTVFTSVMLILALCVGVVTAALDRRRETAIQELPD